MSVSSSVHTLPLYLRDVSSCSRHTQDGVGVGVGSGVAVGMGLSVGVGTGVAVGAGVGVGTGVAVGTVVGVGAGSGVGVAVGKGVAVGVSVWVGVGVGTGVAVGAGAGVGVGAGVDVGGRGCVTSGVGKGAGVGFAAVAVGTGGAPTWQTGMSGTSLSASLRSLTGMAKLMPVITCPSSVPPIPLVLTPTTQPYSSINGPPLFPGFRDASVCRNPKSSRLAEIIPVVTAASRPNSDPRGKPMAMTVSPTRISSESPKASGLNLPLDSISI